MNKKRSLPRRSYKKAPDRSSRNKKRGFVTKQFSGKMTLDKDRYFFRGFFKVTDFLSHLISHIATRAYGATAFCFGMVSLLLYFLRLSRDTTIITPIMGAAIAVLSIPFMLSDKPLPLFLQDFAVTDYIFFEFFCIKRFNKMESEQRFPIVISVLFGIVLAAVGVIYPSWKLAVIIGCIVFAYVCLLSPEFSFFVSLIALPYMNFIPHSQTVFSTLILLTVVSFARKAAFGKRVVNFESYDAVIGVMMLLILVSGFFSHGAHHLSRAVGMVFMVFGYTVAGNLVINRRLADRAVNSIVISSIPPAALSLAKFAHMLWLGRGRELIDEGVYSVFSSGEAFAVFMIVAATFAIAMCRQCGKRHRIFYVCAAVMDFAALAMTGEFFAVLALLLGLGAYQLFRMGRWSSVFLAALVFIPYLVLLLPNKLLNMLLSLIPSLEDGATLFTLWSRSLRIFTDNILVGIGIGSESFAESMDKAGITAGDASNVFLSFGIELGVLSLLCFAALLVIRLIHRAGYYSYVRNSEVSTLAPVCSACVFALVAYGAVSYIFADMYAAYLFWCVFGIGSATLRVAKRESDDRVHYYEDTRASDSSAIDVEIG